MRSFHKLSLALLLTLAGCSAVSFGDSTPQQETVPVLIANNASLMERFTVAVVAKGENVTVTRGTDELVNYTVGQGGTTIKNPETNQFTKVALPKSARIHGEDTLEPGDRKQVDIENVTPNEAIVILIYDEPEETYRAIHTVSCESAILGIRATSMSGGPEDWTTGTHSCG